MDIRPLTPDYAVSPQIELGDLPAIKAAGYTTVIDNRPDGEIPSHLHADAMRQAAEALGLTFVINPVIGGMLTMDNVDNQRAAMQASSGPSLTASRRPRRTASTLATTRPVSRICIAAAAPIRWQRRRIVPAAGHSPSATSGNAMRQSGSPIRTCAAIASSAPGPIARPWIAATTGTPAFAAA
jgi:uncharacterized protein (TIGR01244 family)